MISWGERHLFAADAAADLDPSLPEAGAGQANWGMPGHWTSWASPHWAEGRLTSKDCMSPVKQQISFSPLCCKETSDELTQSTAARVASVIYCLEQFLPSAALRIGTGRLIGFWNTWVAFLDLLSVWGTACLNEHCSHNPEAEFPS